MSVSDRLAPFGVTIFSEMTALAEEYGAVNLGQGFPNWDGADFVKRAAAKATIGGGNDQYPPSHGIPTLREAIASRYGPRIGRVVDPESEITVTCGCTEALAAAFLGLINPGDEVILIEPYYDAYPVYISMVGAVPRYVTLRAPEFALDLDELRAAFSTRTKAILVNNPHNPTGRVFSSEELGEIASLCHEFDSIAITDEVYEEMVFDGVHQHLASHEGMWDRTLTLSSLGKTFSLTGWKVGWGIGPESLTKGLRAAHQFVTFTTPTPVQHGAAEALGAPDQFFVDLRDSYREKRDLLSKGLADVGFEVYL
ncbi:MAG: aminotransferase class I/II-fold pyridoxal phosphate-dependent enzyme, partial [Actinobacteria bacterium]|nr:aminotransferase class I/II-fold pyridoxal phosphate-dependent enzyme [Actinomycetota bacterium]